jgi:hypothetical protein
MLTVIRRWKLANLHILIISRDEQDIRSTLSTMIADDHTFSVQCDSIDREIRVPVHARLSVKEELG